MTGKSTLLDIDLAGKTALVRVDYNVPFHPSTTEISDDSRIVASLPTLRYLIDQKCRVVLCSHLGRPNGAVTDGLHMAPVSKRLSELLDKQVSQLHECVGPNVHAAVRAMEPREVIMLENLRFHKGEEANDISFAHDLSSVADVYVNDAFGVAHRAHASTAGVARFLPAVAGTVSGSASGSRRRAALPTADPGERALRGYGPGSATRRGFLHCWVSHVVLPNLYGCGGPLSSWPRSTGSPAAGKSGGPPPRRSCAVAWKRTWRAS